MSKKEETVSFDLKSFSTPAAIVLVGAMISLALFFGLRSSKPPTGEVSGTSGAPPSQPTVPQEPRVPQTAKTFIDDDPILGDKETATVGIVEFSDYECPFCKRFADETLPQIKENYIDTGKAILVFRDLPLPFHNPAAEREAQAAECAREQGGDEKYFEYHDKIFETTAGNGAGIDADGLADLAEEIGLETSDLKTCLDEERFAEEVEKDSQDAAQAGISGTPGFVVGKLGKDGSVEGAVIEGALPYSNFAEAIDAQLAD
jgi:protein-disulfide isomerase